MKANISDLNAKLRVYECMLTSDASILFSIIFIICNITTVPSLVSLSHPFGRLD